MEKNIGIKQMSEDEIWEYIGKHNPHPINEEHLPLHFNTLEEYHKYYSDAIPIEEFDKIIMEEYGM